jgi:two-component system, chemotaxis family, sensor kinase CheA
LKQQLAARLREVFRMEVEADVVTLRDAFQGWQQGLPEPSPAACEEVYKLAHKIKGACRAVSFNEGQTLGFLIEYLFRALHEKPQAISPGLVTDATTCMDTFIAALTAFLEGAPVSPLSTKFVTTMNGHLTACGSSHQSPVPSPAKPAVNPRLLASFRAEAAEILETLHACLDSSATGADQREVSNDALRAAHTLKGAAGVVKMPDLVSLAHALEDELRAMGENAEASVLAEARQRARTQLRAIEQSLSQHEVTGPPPATNAPASPSKPLPVAPLRPAESAAFFRVEQARLKKLEESFSELLITAPRIEGLTDESSRLMADFEALSREEEALRRSLGTFLYRAPENQEYARAASYVNFVSRHLRMLLRAAGRLDGNLRQVQVLVGQRLNSLDDHLHSLQVTPAGDVLAGLGPMVEELGRELGKPVQLTTSGFDLEMDRPTLQRLRGAIIHILRNAIDHGLETSAERVSAGKPSVGSIRLSLALSGGEYELEIADDGRGLSTREIRRQAVQSGFLSEEEASNLDDERLHRLIFNPNFSTSRDLSEVSGRGMGLSSVEETVRSLNGSFTLDSQPGRGLTFKLRLPAGRSGSTALLVQAGGQTFGIPAQFVEKVIPISASQLHESEGKSHWMSPDGPVPVHRLSDLLDLPSEPFPESALPAVVIRRVSGRDLLVVDTLLGLRQVVLRELPPAASATGLFGGCIPLDDGEAGLLLEVPALFARSGVPRSWSPAPVEANQASQGVSVILVVDDSYTSRTLEASVIESMGHRVLQAADGMDGLRILRNEPVDLILSDIEMPRLDGFGFLTEVKKSDKLRDIPFILISSLEDQNIVQKGLALGADSYIIKRFFEQDELKATIQHYL